MSDPLPDFRPPPAPPTAIECPNLCPIEPRYLVIVPRESTPRPSCGRHLHTIIIRALEAGAHSVTVRFR